MRKLFIILSLFITIKVSAQTTPYQPVQVNQMTWVRDYMDRMWGYRGTTLGYKLFPDSVQVARMISGSAPATLTFSNGLTKTGSNVTLGGNLTGFTVINTGGTNFFAVGNSGAGAGGSTQILPNGSSLAYKSADGGINKLQFNGLVGGGLDNTIILDDALLNKGVQYAGDYESNFTGRSLVTKNYTDALDANNFKLTGAGTNIVTKSTTFNSGTVTFNGDIAANTNLYVNPGGNGLQLNSGAVATWVNGDNTSRYFVRNVATSHYDSTAGLSISEYPFLNGGISIIGNNIKDDNGKLFLKQGEALAPDTLSVGNLYKQTTWNNFNDFTAQGNYTLVNGNIHITAAQADILTTNYVTSLSNFILSYTYKATNGLSNAAGVRFGLKTINIVSAAGFQFWFDEVTRKINLFNVSTSTTTTGTSVLPAYTPGDLLTISVAYTNPTEIFTLTNQTTGQSITMSGTSLFSINRGNLAIYAQNTSVAYDIQSIVLSTSYRNGGNLFIGDSIDNGSLATPGNGYTFQLNGQIQAGNGDYTVGVIAGLSEIIKLKPETAYIKIGTNDAFIGIWQANIVSIVSTLQNAGIRVVLISPPPRNTVDMSPYLAFLQAQYPSQTIDAYTPLKAAVGTGMNAAYDSGDGIHPNQAGHNLLATTVSGSPLWHVAVYTKALPTDILASRITNTTVTPGYYNGLSTFKVRGDGRVENASSLGVQTNLGAMYYTTGGKIGVSSQVTINGSAVVANTFYGNSTWAATSQGTNFLSFLTAGNSNLVARMFNSGGMTVGVGLSADPGANTLSVAGGTIAARFQGQSTASLTSVGTNLVQIATQSNANVVARHFDSGGATVGIGLSTDPGANNLQVGSKLGVGSATVPTARFHATAGGTTAAGTAPLKFTSGALMTTPEVGAFEFLTDGLYFTQTTSTARQQLAYLASPTFTGTPTLPTGTIGTTQTAGNNTTALATTAFVTTADNLKANIASPSLTGAPLAPTAAVGTNTTQIATTAFVLANTKLSQEVISSFSTSQTIASSTTSTLYIATGASNVMFTLPTVASMYDGATATGRSLTFKNAGTASLILQTVGGETIDGATTIGYNPNDAIKIVSTGTAWRIIARTPTIIADGVIPLFGSQTINSAAWTGNNNLVLIVDATSGNATITLPTPTTQLIGYRVFISKKDASVNTITPTPVLGGGVLITQYQSLTYVCDGNFWYPQ